MASISVTEDDFRVLAFAAVAAQEAGYADDANRLDRLARMANAALCGDGRTSRRAAIGGLSLPPIRWQDMPSTLDQ